MTQVYAIAVGIDDLSAYSPPRKERLALCFDPLCATRRFNRSVYVLRFDRTIEAANYEPPRLFSLDMD